MQKSALLFLFALLAQVQLFVLSFRPDYHPFPTALPTCRTSKKKLYFEPDIHIKTEIGVVATPCVKTRL